jgi:hypothetical protein
MAESQEKDAPKERDLPGMEKLPRIEALPAIEDLPEIELPRAEGLPLFGDPRPASDPRTEAAGDASDGRPRGSSGGASDEPSGDAAERVSVDASGGAEVLGDLPRSAVPRARGVPRESGGEASPEDGSSLKDEIFAMASTVEVEDASRSEPLLRLWQGPATLPSASEIGRATAGFLTFVFVDAVMMSAPLMSSDRPSLLPQMVALLLLAFGLGGLLVWKVQGAWRPFGAGMMLGWVFLTLVSLGLLTGVSP